MLVSYEWLKRYVDITVDAEELGKKLTMAGITVDLVHFPGKNISNVLAGKIMEIEKHPDADKLVVCQIAMGDEYKDNLGENGLLQIVTGAPNVLVGQTVPVAVHNSMLPGGKIKKSKLRGVPSMGMLCSKNELDVEPALTDVDGIWILDDKIPAGADCVKSLMLDDPILELDLTPNRSDCMSIINLAREVSAILGTDMHFPDLEFIESDEVVDDIAKITVEDADICPRYTGRVIKGLKVEPSPYWLQHCLNTAGVRSINNIVDISNFVMLEYGVPMHTFDYKTLANNEIIVRRSVEGEKIVTLDEQERELPTGSLLICDGEKAICVAGVMGGLNTEVEDDTTDILLEVAAFNNVSIRKTSRALGLRSEASQRYEKGVDISNLDVVSRRAMSLLSKLCGGKVAKGIIDVDNSDLKQAVVMLKPEKVNRDLGTDFTEEEIVGAISSLKFDMEKVEGGYAVTIPFYRPDISYEVDLTEEVVRLLGFDRVPTTLPYGTMTEGKLTAEQSFNKKVKELLMANKANEIINYGFISPKEWDKLQLPADHKFRETVEIMNPLNEDQSIMRTTLVTGMLNSAARNHNRRQNDLLLFETGMTFTVCGDELPVETKTLAVVASGKTANNWSTEGVARDYFYMKGILEFVLDAFRVENVSYKAISDVPYLHPGRGAAVYVGDIYLGYIGEIHPTVKANYGLKDRATVMEINLHELFMNIQAIPQYKSLPKFPSSVRDMAIVVDKAVPVQEIEDNIKANGGKFLIDVSLFDVYEGLQLGIENRSLAYNLTYQCDERTLTVEEVTADFDKTVALLAEKFNAKLRA